MGPGGGFGGPGMRGSGGGSEGNDRALAMLRSMDANGDGRLEMKEIPEYRRPFVSMMITRLGGDPNRTVNLADLERKARSSSSTTVSSGTGGTTADPLVKPFGEMAATENPVLAFGQREPESKVATQKKPAEAKKTTTTDKIQQSARELMNKYDLNRNGYLDKDKGEWVKSLPFDANAADKNKDGRISMAEMIAALGGKTDVTSGYVSFSYRPSEPYDRLPSGVPDWFLRMDKDQDGQITMFEYAEGKPWTVEIAKEFTYLDKNGDGIVTIEECFATLKEYDTAKAKKEDDERRKQERLNAIMGKGGSSPNKPGEEKKGDQPGAPNAPADPNRPGPPPTPAPPSNENPQPATPPNAQSTTVVVTETTTPPSSPQPVSEVQVNQPPQNAPYSSGSAGADASRQQNQGHRRRPRSH